MDIQYYKYKDRKWANWTGFGETKVITTTKNENNKITISEQIRSEKTLWDALELSGRLAVPILLAVFGYQVQNRDKKRAEEQAELEREIAQDNLAEEATQAYLDNMAKLLLDEKLRKELFSDVELKLILSEKLRKKLSTNGKLNFLDKDNPVKDIARTQTITILRRFGGDRERQNRIIHFLRDAELYGFIFENANLTSVNLQKTGLSRVNLQRATLWFINLQSAILNNANLQETVLWGANLQVANLRSANLQGAFLREADLRFADLHEANLRSANLQGANLWFSKNLTPEQIKSACFWDEAIYKSDWNDEEETYVVIEPDNTNFIEDLKKDKSSDPEEPPDCSSWIKMKKREKMEKHETQHKLM